MALSSALISLGTLIGIYGLLALGLNIKFGYGGLLDIGHVTFYLIGAYVTALLVLPAAAAEGIGATYILGLDLPWLVAAAGGIIAAGIAGMLIALPAIRLREDYLAITVLGFSVIAKRIVQTQGWLANGPRSLRGWPAPFRDVFPLPGRQPSSIELLGVPVPAFDYVLFGVVVFVFFSIATYALAALIDRDVTASRRRTFVHALFALTTLGVGYAGARRAGASNPVDPMPALAAGAVAGVVAVAGSLAGVPVLTTYLMLAALSVFSWVFGAVVVGRRYEAMTRRDVLTGLGLAVAFVGAFLPLILLGAGSGDVLSSVGLILTVALLGAFLYGLYYLGVNWETYGDSAAFVSIIGVGALWLFVIRYFLLSMVDPLTSAGVLFAVQQFLENTLWLLKFTANGVEFGYARFVFVLTIAILAAVYYLQELTVRSPFGRLLKAVREDEDVAAALGKNTFSYKIQSMFLGSAVAGLAGALWALSTGALIHTMFAPRITFIVFLMVIIGGTANNRGVILGSVIFWAFQQGTSDIKSFFPTAASTSISALRLAFIGALLIIILYYRPQGIWREETTTSPEVSD